MKITYKGVTKDLKFYKGLKWSKPLTPKMKEFQKETGKNPVYRGIITGTFEYWMYWQKPSKKTTTKKGKGDIARLKVLYDKTDKFHSPEENRKIMDEIRKMEKEIAQRNKKKRLQEEFSKRKYTKRELNKIEEWESEIAYIDKRIKQKEQTIKGAIKEEMSRYDKLITEEKNKPNPAKWRLKELDKKKWKVRSNEYDKMDGYRKEKIKYQNKLLEYELEFNKINKLVKGSGLRQSNWVKSHQVKGYGETTTGYKVYRPTIDSPKIIIEWNTYWNAKPEAREESIKKFREKLTPILKANNIKYKIDESRIVIVK